MKVKLDRNICSVDASKVRVETENLILHISECKSTGRIIINKVDGAKSSALCVFPRYSNEIDVE